MCGLVKQQVAARSAWIACVATFLISIAPFNSHCLASDAGSTPPGHTQSVTHIEVYEPSLSADTGAESPEKLDGRWINIDKVRDRIGNRLYPQWFRIDMRTVSLSENSSWALVIHDQMLSDVRVFPDEGGNNIRGLLHPGAPRTLRFEVVRKDEPRPEFVYARIQSPTPLQFAAEFIPSEDAILSERTEATFRGLLFGLMAVMLGANLIMFIRTQEALRFWYIVYVGSSILLNAILTGVIRDVSFLNHPEISLKGVHFAGPFVLIGQTEFIRRTLDLKTNFPKMNRIAVGYEILLAITAFIFVTFNPEKGAALAQVLGLLGCLLCTALSIASLRRNPHAIYLVGGFSAFWLSGITFTLSNIGVLPIMAISRNATLIGAVVESLCLSIVLARMYEAMHEDLVAKTAGLESMNRALSVEIERRRAVELELRDNQEIMTQSARMRSLGEMAAGIAHEINNPLNTIVAKAEAMRYNASLMHGEAAESVVAACSKIDANCIRISKIIRTMKMLCNDTLEDEAQPVSVARLCDSVVEMAQSRAKSSGVRLSWEGRDTTVPGRESELAQILVNLLNNSIDAVQEFEQPWVRVEVTESDDVVRIAVVDCGKGIPEAVSARIMEPFFTSKVAGQGCGLGLTISQKLAQRHGGRLELDQKRTNTTLVLTLPKRFVPARPFVAA